MPAAEQRIRDYNCTFELERVSRTSENCRGVTSVWNSEVCKHKRPCSQLPVSPYVAYSECCDTLIDVIPQTMEYNLQPICYE